MSEGMIEGVLGGGEGGDSAEEQSPRIELDPAAAAAALDIAKFDPVLAAKTGAYFDQQRDYVRIQTEHLHEQREVALSSLKLKRLSEALKIALQSAVLAAAALVACLAGTSLWDAALDHGLVVEAFSVPPAIAQRGLTGQVVAKQVLDRLAALQDEASSYRKASSYENNWGDELKVEIPETGVSLTELGHVLRAKLGQETRISGELYLSPAGLTVTARAGEDTAKSFSGGEADYDKLITQAAEEIYRRTQPYRYATYLHSHGHPEVSLALFRQLAQDTQPIERAWAHIGIATLQSRPTDVCREGEKSLDQAPGFAPAYVVITICSLHLSHYEQVLSSARNVETHLQSLRDQVNSDSVDSTIAYQHAARSLVSGAYRQGIEELRSYADREDFPPYSERLALLQALDHDHAAAAETVESLDPVHPLRPFLLGLRALDEHDRQSLTYLSRFAQMVEEGREDPQTFGWGRRETRLAWQWPLAKAKLQMGDLAGAQSVIEETPKDCEICLVTRGVVAAARGARDEADRWFAEAMRAGPDLPQPYVERGRGRLSIDNETGALEDAQEALKRQPHYAEAYQLLGDIMVQQKNWTAAVAQYDKALSEAPAWAAVRQARAEAAAHRG